MAETGLDGVGMAIAVLQALREAGGAVRTAEIIDRLGVPRSSFYRVARSLADAGLVAMSRGTLQVGPAATAMIRAHAESCRQEDRRRQERTRDAGSSGLPLPAAGPIGDGLELTRPVQRARPRRVRLGFSNASMANPWRVALVHSIEHAAARLGDNIAWLSVRHSGDDASRQCDDIAALIREGADGLIVSATRPERIAGAIAEAMRLGIAVVLVDRGIPDGVPHTSFVTADNADIGRTTAGWLCERLGGSGRVVMLAGDRRARPAQQRYEAAKATFADCPGIDIVGAHWTGWQREIGRRHMAAEIARQGRGIDCVWCDSGLQGVGSMQAFIAAGYERGRIPPHTGGDLNLAYKLAIRHCVPLAAVDYPPAMGIEAVETLYAALRGAWVPKTIIVPSDRIATRGAETRSFVPTAWAEDRVRWDLPDDLILAAGLGDAYSPAAFRVHYPGNSYNRSAAEPVRSARN